MINVLKSLNNPRLNCAITHRLMKGNFGLLSTPHVGVREAVNNFKSLNQGKLISESFQYKEWYILGKKSISLLPSQQYSSLSTRARGKDPEAWGRGKTPYEILDVSTSASQKEIKIAYFRAAKKHHPDVNPDDEAGARVRFQYVSAAYELLSDEKKRREYDANARSSAWSGSDPQRLP